MMHDLIVIAGPTAVGKTELSIRIAEEINGEIVSADSRQVYKFMDIGTAKPSEIQMKKIPHYMIDILYPDEEIDVASFSKLARKKIDSILSKGKQPILVGGTGLYIKGIIDGIFQAPGKNSSIREKLMAVHKVDKNRLYSMLKELDPESALKIHHNDLQRIIRALEIFYLTGSRMSSLQDKHGFKENIYNTVFIGLQRERTELNHIIDYRVDKMIQAGFIDEVKKHCKSLWKLGLSSAVAEKALHVVHLEEEKNV